MTVPQVTILDWQTAAAMPMLSDHEFSIVISQWT
jgi:hypothetical protein